MKKKESRKEVFNLDNILFLVRAYNEEKTIANVIDDLRNHGCKHILVVNDCSTDRTSEIARSKDVLVVDHKINMGGGAALETGLFIAESLGFPAVITFDADSQHMAKDISKFIKKLNAGYDVVIGSRFLGHAINMPFIRRLVLKGGIIFTQLISGIKLSDAHNGFRAFNKKAYSLFKFKYSDMTYASELLDIVSKNKLKYCEVPVTIRYFGKEHGQSNWNAIIIAIKMILKKLIFW